MPKIWLYFIALCMPFGIRLLIMNTDFLSWLWYNQYVDYYYFFSALSVNPYFLQFVGGWALPAFIIFMIFFWGLEVSYGNGDALEYQFLLLPLFYVPFTIAGEALTNLDFNSMSLFAHPVIVLPFGYLYVIVWAVFLRVMESCNLTIS